MRLAVLMISGAALLAGCSGTPEVSGPPCDALTREQAGALGYSTREESTVGWVVVRRQYGRSMCQEVSGGARCELSIPGLVHVTANGQDSWFNVTPGRPATITVDRDGARCVVGPAAT